MSDAWRGCGESVAVVWTGTAAHGAVGRLREAIWTGHAGVCHGAARKGPDYPIARTCTHSQTQAQPGDGPVALIRQMARDHRLWGATHPGALRTLGRGVGKRTAPANRAQRSAAPLRSVARPCAPPRDATPVHRIPSDQPLLTVTIVQEERKRMAKPELEFHRPTGPWVPDGGCVRGIWTQTLAADPRSGAYTGLVRYKPGVDTSRLGVCVHDYWEEVYCWRAISPPCAWARRSAWACLPAGRRGCRTGRGRSNRAADAGGAAHLSRFPLSRT
jgi:hypothetical protein